MKKKILTIALCVAAALGDAAATKPGVEVLRDNDFKQLAGKRVGLITNPTGVDNNLKSTVDILHEAKGVELVALFGPEHGVRGNVHAGDEFGNTTDPATGVKVFSIYGKTKKPTKEMLSGIDALVYDIQDNGCRSYTFISTMGLAMQQCAATGTEFMVLDRPNPLGGNKVEGSPVSETRSFVNQFAIPYLYGLTPGELAEMLVAEKLITLQKPLKLTVIPMQGWRRDMLYADTGLPWVLPSPHIPSAETAIYYPATGILGELDWASIGVGYTLPFRTIAAPWGNSVELADRLNGLKLPGVRFRPINYRPNYAFGKGTDMGGVEIFVTDFNKAPLTLIQFYAMQELAAMYPAHKPTATPARLQMFDKVTSRRLREAFFRRFHVADMESIWNDGVDDFRDRSRQYHLYE